MDDVIGVVCLNPALDVTHHVAAVNWSGVNRPDEVHARPGGKGLNVARTLHALGAEVLVMGLAGGTTGEAVTAGARRPGRARGIHLGARGRRGGRSPSWTGGPATRPCSTSPARGSRRTGTRSSGPGTRRSWPGARPWSCPGACRRGWPAGSYAELTAMAAARRGAGAAGRARGGAAAGRGRRARDRQAEPGRAGDVRRAVACPGRAARTGRPWRRPPGNSGRRVRGRSWSRWARKGCTPTPATAAGRRSRRPWWPGTRPGPATPRPRAWRTGWPWGSPWDERLRHAVALGTAAALAPVAGEFSPADYATVCWTRPW